MSLDFYEVDRHINFRAMTAVNSKVFSYGVLNKRARSISKSRRKEILVIRKDLEVNELIAGGAIKLPMAFYLP